MSSVLSYFVLGKQIFISFFSVLPKFTNSWGNIYYYNQSLEAAIGRMFGLTQLSRIGYYILVTFIVYLLLKNIKNYYLFLTANILLLGASWQHYLVFLIPALIYLYYTKKLILLTVIFILLSVNIKNPQVFTHNIFGNVLLSHGTIGTVLLFLTLYSQKNRGR